jgi:DNA-binding NtrC family response regulator
MGMSRGVVAPSHAQVPPASADRSRPPTEPSFVCRRVAELSRDRWGEAREVCFVGEHPTLTQALERAARFAEADGPVLVTGETGTGKELFARAVYLLSRRSRKPFLAINCAQYHDGQLLASELFGHRRGSFTGAVGDHRGVFEEAEGGVVFLDEIGELSVPAQAMLLRVLGEGEILTVGTTQSKRVNVRMIAATSRDLRPMVESGRFREDLYYRLRHLQVRVPALRERGEDWRLVLDYYLERVVRTEGSRKRFSSHALSVLARYAWPGNVRELRSLVDTGYYVCDGATIEAEHFAEALEGAACSEELRTVPVLPSPGVARAAHGAAGADPYGRMVACEGTFWELVHAPYMARQLSRAEVRRVVERGLVASRGSYKRVLALFGIAEGEYLKFMDFLRHHDLKPEPASPRPVPTVPGLRREHDEA